jgi:filamentous hemagglutinin family protein
MTQSWMSWGCKLGSASFLALGGAIATFCNFARAQITPDGTLGAESSAVTPLVNINGLPSERLDGGAIRGTNLFHSFREFNIDEGRGAYFTNPDGIANILSRVTGNDPTDVLGTLGVLGNANLFLINPNGIIFGPNASLDVGGSFLGSTASSLNFADGKQFSTTAPQTTPLLSVSVPIGLQFGETGGSILNQSQVTNTSGRQVGLQVQPGKTLALVGGDVALEGGGLQAEGGRISLGSVAGIGLVGLNPTDNGWALKYEGVQNQDIQLSQQAVVDVSGEGGGDIQIQGGRVALTEGSKIVANTLGSQSGGEINIQASQLQIQDGAFVSASTFGSGGAGNLSVAADTVELIGPGGREFLERLLNGTFSQSDIRNGLFTVSFGPGAAGSLTITTGNLIVKDGAEVSTSTYTQGAGGSITVRASDSVQVSGSLLFAGTQSAGNGGDLNIDTKKLILQDFATVTTDPFAQGQGGDLTVNASDYVEVVGAPTDDPFFVTGIFSNSLPLLEDIDSGDSGDVTINTGRLIVRDGGEIGAGTFGNGKGGNLIINASESVEVLGVTPDQLRLPSNVYADTFGTGNIGKLTVSTRRLTIRDGGQISAATFAQGQGGNLIVNATESVEVGDGYVGAPIEESPRGWRAPLRARAVLSSADRNHVALSTGNLGG